MHSRPHAATVVVRCTIAGCECEQQVSGRVYKAGERGELIERPLPPQCAGCGHPTTMHATARVELHDVIERRTRPRE